MKILYLHGWHSVVGGVKPNFLRQQGCEILNPVLDNDDFQLALQAAQGVFDTEHPDIIVGSSRGGALAMNLRSGDVPLVLLCPAWKRWGNATHVKPNVIILHSRDDEVIPFADSEILLRNSQLPIDALIEVGQDHRLADEASLSAMLWSCEFLCGDDPPEWIEGAFGKSTTQVDAHYLCDSCGEEIIIPIDPTAGNQQQYVEDCPVCCHPSIIHVDLRNEETPYVWAEPEQDYD